MKNRQSLIARIHQLTNTPRWGVGDLLYLCLVVIITISIANRIEWARSAPQLPPGWTIMAAPPVSPLGTGNTTTEPTVTPTPITQKSIDAMVAASAQKYGKSDDDVDRIKVTLHFLLYRESRYGKNKKCGDNSRACGPLQFWAETFSSYRQAMISQGHATEVGSRYDIETAIDTTAWALTSGKSLAWGPLLRREIKLRKRKRVSLPPSRPLCK